MPSPFPGMDPYLEGSEWTSVHAELAGEIAKQLVPKVAPKYTVRVVRRFVMDVSGDVGIVAGKHNTYPDAGVYTVAETPAVYTSQPVVTKPLIMETVMPERIPISSVEIRDVQDRELVTAIELLSPANKRGEGFAEYVKKRLRILNSDSHLLEIDLLRHGKRIPMRQPLPEAAYFLFLSRVEKRPSTEVWPIQLNQSLPTIPIPLLPDDEDVTLELQQAFTVAYDAYRYDLSLDYTQPPDVPLKGEWAKWAAALLQ